MVDIKWCLKMKKGIELIELNENMSESYLKMAEESLRVIKNVEQSKIWIASTVYYTMYYSLYSLMMKIGVKCEIHKCSIGFMKNFLLDFYNLEDVELIETAFEIRNLLQYYPGKLFDEHKLKLLQNEVGSFFIKTKEILGTISGDDVKSVREKFNEVKKK